MRRIVATLRPGRGTAAPRRRWGGASERRAAGQSLVELALILPLLLLFGLACIQFALIFRTYDDMVNVTRDAARWVSVHAQNTDTTTRAAIDLRLPASIATGRLTMTFSPPCASLSGTVCTGRTTGAQISVTSTYDITDVLFLPATLGTGAWTIRIPTTLPSYTIFMQVEPS
jgi:Flp pilus assembly protein TadG